MIRAKWQALNCPDLAKARHPDHIEGRNENLGYHFKRFVPYAVLEF